MNPPEVLDHKADLMVRLENGDVYRAWREQLVADSVDAINLQRGNMKIEVARSNAAANITTLKHDLTDAECYYVSRDMTTLVSYAASQLDDEDRIDRTVMPTRSGIVRFEGGLSFVDVRGVQLRISWAAWGPILMQFAPERGKDTGEPSEQTAIWLFNDHREEPDEIARRMFDSTVEASGSTDRLFQVFGRWGFIGSEMMIDGTKLGGAWVDPGDRKRSEVLADGHVPQEFTNAQRYLHAFWLMLGQTSTSVSDSPLPRPYRKRADKRGIPPRVVVITLRTPRTQREQGESLVEWSHRWVVRGFWRWQPCGPHHPLAQEVEPGVYRARIWIAPFVKGPKGKPLIVSEKVYALKK